MSASKLCLSCFSSALLNIWLMCQETTGSPSLRLIKTHRTTGDDWMATKASATFGIAGVASVPWHNSQMGRNVCPGPRWTAQKAVTGDDQHQKCWRKATARNRESYTDVVCGCWPVTRKDLFLIKEPTKSKYFILFFFFIIPHLVQLLQNCDINRHFWGKLRTVHQLFAYFGYPGENKEFSSRGGRKYNLWTCFLCTWWWIIMLMLCYLTKDLEYQERLYLAEAIKKNNNKKKGELGWF